MSDASGRPTTRVIATDIRAGIREAFPHRALIGEAIRTAIPWRKLQPTILYCLRTVLAMAIALYTAFSLQLLSPMSSVITVLIVANPVSGALVSKSLWRLSGTFIGAAAAVLLMAAFAQTPILFFLLFSFWIGLACIVSTLLRFFKAYGAVLAGYTLIIVCAPAFADPQTIFTSAVSRLSAVSVGIASAALVFLLTRIRAPSQLRQATVNLIRSTGTILSEHADVPVTAPSGSLPAAFYDRRAGLLAQAYGLNEIIEYAAADNFAVARHARRLRLGAAGLIGTLTALNPMARWPVQRDTQGSLIVESRAVIAALGAIQLDDPTPVLDRLATQRDRLAASLHIPDETGPDRTEPDLDRLAETERTHDLLTRLHLSIADLTAPPEHPAIRPDAPRLRLFLDWPTALRNGSRGAIVTMLACLFWYVTMWPSAPTLLSYLVPASCLLATNPSAAKASIDFSTGTLLAIPASFVYSTWMLPQIEGFPLLMGALALCLLPGIWLQFHPRHGLRAFGYVVFLSAMITVRNPQTYNDIGLINTWLAFIIGTAALITVFRALLPPNPRQDANSLIRSITAATARTARSRRPPTRQTWEYLQIQKVVRLAQRLQSLAKGGHQELIDQALITIELGRDVLRLRGLLDGAVLEPPEREATTAALAALGRIRRHPGQAAAAADAAARLLVARNPPANLRRIAALLHGIAALAAAASDFLSSDLPVPLPVTRPLPAWTMPAWTKPAWTMATRPNRADPPC